ncbi:hypothetical protein P7K49_009981, partial [Saguinus oedipus]
APRQRQPPGRGWGLQGRADCPSEDTGLGREILGARVLNAASREIFAHEGELCPRTAADPPSEL